MHTRAWLLACFAAALFSAHIIGVEATYQYFAGYEPLSNVTHHSMIDLDLKDIMDGLGSNCGEDLNDCSATPACPGNACQYSADDMSFPTDAAQCAFTVADYAKTNAPACSNSYDIWMDGKNSLKDDSVRSISKFASGAESKGSDAAIPYKDNAFIKVMNEYWESKGLDKYTWGYDMIKAAFDGTQIGQLNFGTVGRTFRKEAIQKGLLYLNVYPYAIWEMQDQINDCRIDGTNEDPSVKAWDEAVAFWAGSLTRGRAYGQTEDKEGYEDNFIYALGDKRWLLGNRPGKPRASRAFQPRQRTGPLSRLRTDRRHPREDRYVDDASLHSRNAPLPLLYQGHSGCEDYR
jgi:hypothetical protein